MLWSKDALRTARQAPRWYRSGHPVYTSLAPTDSMTSARRPSRLNMRNAWMPCAVSACAACGQRQHLDCRHSRPMTLADRLTDNTGCSEDKQATTVARAAGPSNQLCAMPNCCVGGHGPGLVAAGGSLECSTSRGALRRRLCSSPPPGSGRRRCNYWQPARQRRSPTAWSAGARVRRAAAAGTMPVNRPP